MTELYRIYTENGLEAAEKHMRSHSNEVLLSDLDDLIQFDLLKMENAEYAALPAGRVLQRLLQVIYERMRS